jgi:hypothetical protein
MKNVYHFEGSRAAVNMHEPLYLTKYSCNIVLPKPLAQKYGNSELLIEQHLKIDGLDLDKIPGTQMQNCRGNQRAYIGTIVDTSMVLTFDFEVNINPETLVPYPYDLLRDWSKLLYDPHTAAQSLKVDYAGSATIEVHDKIQRLIKFVDIPIFFPISKLPAWNLSATSDAIYKITGLQFRCENSKDALAV